MELINGELQDWFDRVIKTGLSVNAINPRAFDTSVEFSYTNAVGNTRNPAFRRIYGGKFAY